MKAWTSNVIQIFIFNYDFLRIVTYFIHRHCNDNNINQNENEKHLVSFENSSI